MLRPFLRSARRGGFAAGRAAPVERLDRPAAPRSARRRIADGLSPRPVAIRSCTPVGRRAFGARHPCDQLLAVGRVEDVEERLPAALQAGRDAGPGPTADSALRRTPYLAPAIAATRDRAEGVRGGRGGGGVGGGGGGGGSGGGLLFFLVLVVFLFFVFFFIFCFVFCFLFVFFSFLLFSVFVVSLPKFADQACEADVGVDDRPATGCRPLLRSRTRPMCMPLVPACPLRCTLMTASHSSSPYWRSCGRAGCRHGHHTWRSPKVLDRGIDREGLPAIRHSCR